MRRLSRPFALVFAALTLAANGSAKPTKPVPFVGVRGFNFFGGTGTGRVVAIEKSGRVRIWHVGVCSVGLAYDGPWKLDLPLGDGQVVRLDRASAALFRGGRPVRGCSDATPSRACAAALERVDAVPRTGPTGLC